MMLKLSVNTVIHCQTHTLGVGGVSSAVSSPSCCKTNIEPEIRECALTSSWKSMKAVYYLDNHMIL